MSGAGAGLSVAHEVRITSHGKIASWVSFALDHLQKYEEKPLVLHTLPAAKAKPSAHANGDRRECLPGREKKAKGEGLHPSLSTIPRLVSVVEIIKREYLKTLDPALAEGGSLGGLHQYNEIGNLVEEGYMDREEDERQRLESLAHSMEGHNHVKQKKIVFMRVTLSRREIPELVGMRATSVSVSLRRTVP
ncbi:hypothetical protein BC628DRAFT_1345165 [Trametes gibbosa]|nr:hypothetical protein BC628DRAFT_1345165 [Trametes gibbosa]